MQTRAQTVSAASPVFKPSQVIHRPDDKKFVLPLPTGEEAILEYEVISPGIYDYTHTFTPKDWRGKGLSDVVSTAAMEFIKKNHYKVALTCGYLATTFIDRHPEYQDLLLASDPMSSIEMPEDVIALILMSLSERQRFLRAALVNHRWRRAALKYDIPLLDLTQRGLIGFQFIKRLGSYNFASGDPSQYLTRLKVADIDLAVLEALAAFMPRLIEIEASVLNDNGEILRSELDEIKKWNYLKSLKYLRSLNLPRYFVPEFHFAPAHIVELTLHAKKLFTHDVASNFSLMTKLERLTLVRAKGTPLSLECFGFAENFRNLKDLTLSLFEDERNGGIFQTAELPQLESLTIIPSENDEAFIQPRKHGLDIDLSMFSRFPKLKSLSIDGTALVTMPGQELNLTKFEGMSNPVNILNRIASLSELRYLKYEITRSESELEYLAECFNLESLEPIGSYLAERLVKTIRKWKRLQYLILEPNLGWESPSRWPTKLQFGSSLVRDSYNYSAIAGLIKALPKSLTYLRTNVPMESELVFGALKSLKYLQVLHFTVDPVYDVSVQNLSELRTLVKLKWLAVEGRNKKKKVFDAAVLSEFLKLFPSLEKLSLGPMWIGVFSMLGTNAHFLVREAMIPLLPVLDLMKVELEIVFTNGMGYGNRVPPLSSKVIKETDS